MSLNVNRNVSDMFYRYKMPKLIAKVEGKGNGIKTVIVNMSDVAKSLGRPPTYPTKYFGCELGAQTYFDFKDDRFIVNGSHEVSKLQDLLDGFIKKFVLCQGCENPETTLCISVKKSTVHQSCKACGHYAQIKGAHRLITFILKNPPDIAPAQQGSSLTEGKRHKRSKKHNGEENGDGSSPKPEDGDDDDDDDWYDSSPKEANNKDDDDDDWAVDVSEEAIRDRQNNLVDGIKILELADKTEKERTDMFFKYLQEKMKNGKKLDDKEILMEAERLDVRQKACLILAELFFTHEILKQIKTYRVILLRFCHNNPKAQKYLIGGIEQVINLNKETLLPKVPLIFKGLYDLDILEEEVLMEWHSKASKKYVSKELSEQIHVKCDPFIKWLKEAEEEESSEEEDEDDDDDVEIEYDDRARITSLSTQKEIEAAAASRKLIENQDTGKNKKEEDEDEFDIDAI